MKIFYIDLFSGAGGTTTGIHLLDNPNIRVVACVNHDAKAIESHKANHPECIHFVEDVRDMKVIQHIAALARTLRRDNPGCVIVIWASLECTNYSKAKGGQPRDADSRTLAYSLYDYIEAAQPDYVKIENVREFMSWGPILWNQLPGVMEQQAKKKTGERKRRRTESGKKAAPGLDSLDCQVQKSGINCFGSLAPGHCPGVCPG